MQLDFSNQTALVTGASRGIGKQIATDLASSGARLVVTSTRESDKEALEQQFSAETRHMAVDFSDASSRDAFLEEVRALPELHVLINNAGATRHGPLEDASEDDWDVTHDVNLKAPFFLSQAVAEVMKRQKYGRIVNISSIWGHMTINDRSLYTAAKHGLRGLTLSYALELGKFNVLVNVVSPGFTMTDMVKKNYTPEMLEKLEAQVPVGRMGTVEDISRAVLFLASNLNSYITGQSLVVDGGYSIA